MGRLVEVVTNVYSSNFTKRDFSVGLSVVLIFGPLSVVIPPFLSRSR